MRRILENIRILCVDDEETIARFLAKILKYAGAKTGEAHNVEEALTIVQELYPNVIITDLEMPEKNDGDIYDIAGLLLAAKAKDINPGIKVILYTGRERGDSRLADMNLFFDEYLQKPSWREVIFRAVKKIIA